MRSLLCILLTLFCGLAFGQPTGRVLTLRQAITLAEESNPALRSAQAAVAAAEGESAAAASLLRDNPELNLEFPNRRVPEAEGVTSRYRESAVGISQTFEIAGQQGYRRLAAGHALAAARLDFWNTRISVRAEVESAFAKVLLLQRRLIAEERNLELADQAAGAVGKRVSAGEDSRLDGNLSHVEAERARNQVATVNDRLIEARARLATIVQLPAGELPHVAGELTETVNAVRLDDLLSVARQRPELRALLEREAAAQNRLQVERSAAFPDITVGLSTLREGPPEFRERATIFSVTVPLPFFNQNRAGIGRALAERDRAQIEREAAWRNGEAVVRELWQRLQLLQTRVARLANSVLPRLDENLSLSSKAYQAGELGILPLLLVNRQVLDARRDYLEALGDFTQVRIALEQAAALHGPDTATPTNSGYPKAP